MVIKEAIHNIGYR